MKRQPTEKVKIFANNLSDKRLISKINKELIKLILKKKRSEDLNRHFSKGDIQKISRYMTRCSETLIIRKMQIKNTTRFHLITMRVAMINNHFSSNS